MRRSLTSFVMAAMAGLFVLPLLSALEIGAPRVSVLQELGQPVSAIGRGDSEVLTYRDGVRIKLKHKRVVEIIGLKRTTDTVQKVEPVPDQPSVSAEETAGSKQKLAAGEQFEKQQIEADAKARAQMEQAITDMEGIHQKPSSGPASFNLSAFFIELGVKCILTLAALVISCKYWNSDVPWTGLLIVAVVDVAVRGLIGFIGFKLLDMMSLFYADEAIASVVMVLVLRKVSINQRLSLAIEVVLTTKTFSIVVGSFLVTVLLRLLA